MSSPRWALPLRDLRAAFVAALLLVVLCLSPRLAAAQSLGSAVHEFTPEVVVSLDPTGVVGFEEVSGGAATFVAPEPGRTPGGVATWLRFTVDNDGSAATEVFITYLYTFTDHVDIWFQPARGPPAHVAIDNETRVGDRQVAWGKPTAHFPLAAGERAVVHVRLSSVNRYPTALVVSDQVGWTTRSARARLLRGLQGGISLLLILACLAIAWSIRERSLVLLAVGIAAGLGRGLVGDGSVLWFLGDQDQATANYVVVCAGIPAIALMVRSYARPGQLWRWLDLALKWLPLPMGLIFLTYLADVERLTLLLHDATIPLSLLLVLVAIGRILMNPTRGIAAVAVACATIALGALANFAAVTSALDPYLPAWVSGTLDPDGRVPWILGLLVFAVAAAQRTRGLFDDRADALRKELVQAQRAASLATAYGRYVPHEFLALLDTQDIVDIRRGEQVQTEMTIFFSDIRGFTALTEDLTPAETFDFINDYLAAMAPDFVVNQGVIDKYIGDAIMGLFDPGDGGDGPDRALRCALGNLVALEHHNRARGPDVLPLRIGIGLHTGPVMLGMLGSEDRLNATVLGDSVNLASRVEAMTKAYGAQILITESTRSQLRGEYAMRPVDRVRVKGKEQPVTLHEVFEGTEMAAEKSATRTRFVAALGAFQAGRMAEALRGFEAVLSESDDAACHLYVGRCREHLARGVPAGWDGVTTLTSKSG